MDVSSSSSSSSSSDDSEEIDGLFGVLFSELQTPHVKNEDYVENTVHLFTDKEFKEHFRVNRSIHIFLSNAYKKSDMYPKSETGHERISPEKSILVFLWYAGHEAASFRDVGDRFNITISTLHNIIKNVSMFLSNMSASVVTWPKDEEKVEILNDFENMGFKDVLGVIDGTHVRIDTPSEDPESYYNRKKFYSIHVQGVCDSKRKLRDVFIGFPGSVHDSRVFKNSTIGKTLAEKCGEKYILGDSAYPCLRNLMTPYKDTGTLSPMERNFNKKLSHVRIIIEHTFGLLKQKFRQLYHIKLRDMVVICHFIRACCVLHNLSVEDEDEMDWQQFEENVKVQNIEENIDEENEGNPSGLLYRNYLAALFNE